MTSISKKNLPNFTPELNKSKDLLEVLVHVFALNSNPDDLFLRLINNNLSKRRLGKLKFSVIKFTSEYIIYVNAKEKLSLKTTSKSSLKSILNEIKDYDKKGLNNDNYSQKLRTVLLIGIKGDLKSYDVYTNIRFEKTPKEKIKELLKDSKIWTSQRRRLHQVIKQEYLKKIRAFSESINKSKKLGKGLYCVRGAVASGKSTLVKSYLERNEFSPEAISGVINTDNIKRSLIKMSVNDIGHDIPMYAVHDEGSMISESLLNTAKNENLSYFLDKRMHEEKDLKELSEDANQRLLPITIFDIKTDFITSAIRVLSRTGKYPSDPTPDFDGLYKSYEKIEKGRQTFFRDAMKNPFVKNYYSVLSFNDQDSRILIQKKNYNRLSTKIDSSGTDHNLDVEKLKNIIISPDQMSFAQKDSDMKQCPAEYFGRTLENALAIHSQKSYKNQLTKREYFKDLTKNIGTTSRSYIGEINVSASSDKRSKMNTGLNKKEIKQLTQNNTKIAFDYIYDNKNLVIHNTSVLRDFIDEVSYIINKNLIIDKKHLLRNGENSSKYYYVDTGSVEKFYEAFVEALYSKLIDAESDPIEIAAWIEWNIDFVGHIFSDGCGRIGKMISSWSLIRSGSNLPDYAKGLGDFQTVRASYRKQFSLRKRPAYSIPKDTKEFKAFLNYYNKLF